MSDRFDFLEIDEGRRSQVRRLGPEEGSNKRPPSSTLITLPAEHAEADVGAAPRGRPTDVAPPLVWRVVETIGEPGAGVGQFRVPKGIAVDRSGNLYVADSGNHRVQRIAPDGGVAVLDGARGAPEEPIEVAVDDSLTFYVASRREPGLLHAFTADGALLWRWRAPGVRPGDGWPEVSLTVDRSALVLLDGANGRILRIRIPETGRRPSVIEEIRHPALPHPRRVCADHRGRLIVGEVSRQEIVALRQGVGGGWEPAWRRPLTDAGCAERAVLGDIAADPEGRVFVALPCCGWAVLVADDGRPQRLDLQGMPDEPPSGSLALGPDGSLYVASVSHRIYRLKPAA